jgi:F0F1-type ATP synthase membrane subunit c/vacuolar-type H+-ATPase subunit K
LERLPGGPDTLNRPHPSHRQAKPRRGGIAVGAGVAAALAGLGVAVAVGAVPSPLTSSTAKPLAAASLAAVPSSVGESLLQASASPFGFATAKMPASLASHKPKPSHTPSKTATPTQHPATRQPSTTQSASSGSGGLTPRSTAEYETPSGENQKAWSEAILTALGAPLTSANIVSIGYWMQNEAGKPPYGIVGANNPINVSQPCCGGVPIQDDGDGVTFLQSYPTAADGVEAIAQYLNRGNYTAMLADLKQGVGLMSDSNLASEIGLYSGGGYTTIPDSYGQSQGTPLS